MKATMSYLYGYVSNSGDFWIYSYNRDYPKTQEAQDHISSLWSTPNSEIIKSTHDSLFMKVLSVTTLLWVKCGGEAQHSQSWELGVLWDSRMFRARQQGPKHLALRRS